MVLLFDLPGTQVALAVLPCGKVVKPGDTASFAQALLELARAALERARLGARARQAAWSWEKEKVLAGFERELKLLGGECQ